MALQVWDAAESARLALPFSVTEAVIWGVFLTLLFIIGFFIVKEPAKRTNDDREVILQRMACVAVACVIAPLLLYYMLGHRLVLSHFSVPFHVWLGLPFVGVLQALALPLLLTAILFAGPLLLCYFDQELVFQQNFSFQRDVVAVLTSPIGLRNIIVAPVAEEFMFRGCLVPFLFLAGIPRGVIVATCPLFFGIAHLHHVRDMYKKEKLRGKHEYISIGPILLRAGFQFLYTSVFGAYTTFLFLRTGHVLAPIVCHMFCNTMGFPDFDRISHYPRAAIFIWSVFVLGLVGFAALLFPLTDPALYASAYWIH